MTARTVRIAQPEDEEGLAVLLRLMHAENAMFSSNEAKVRHYLRRAWAKDNAIIGVVGDVGAPIACICLEIGSMHYTDDPMISDRFTFVHPDERGHGIAKALIEFAKICSDNLRLPMMLGVLSVRDLAKKNELYEGLLGKPVGSTFFYMAEPSDQQERAA